MSAPGVATRGSTGRRVALATCSRLPGLDEDGPALVAALAELGIEAVAAVWDDHRVDWASFDLVVIRSTWDYTLRRDDFVAWASALPVPVANPADVLAFSTDKFYLRLLAQRGVPSVPTLWDPAAIPNDGREWVVKPVISSGSDDTARWRPDQREEAATHLRRLQGMGRRSMAQPYQTAVDTQGETAIVLIGDVVSHAVRKEQILVSGAGTAAAMLGKEARESVTPTIATAAQLTVARAAVAAVPGGADRLLYARVDLVPGPNGEPLLLELELAEPSLFLGFAAAAPARFAAAIVARLPVPRQPGSTRLTVGP